MKDAGFSRDRLESAGRQDPEVLFHGLNENGVRVVTRAQISHDDVPRWMAPRFPDGGPVNEREEVWSGVNGVSAIVTVTSPTGGATFGGTYEVTDGVDGSVWRVQGQATFPTPIIGKRVEAFMLKNLDIAFSREADFINAMSSSTGAWK